MPDHLVEEAKRLFRLVQSKNGVQGRSTPMVVLACLYIVCRQNETGHLMVDFADVLGTDIFSLSKTYLKLVRLVRFEVKLSDPSLYVPRFLKVLRFPKDKEKAILDYVLHLLARMRRDWLGKGRRPSGLIAAGFYIACKCFDIERSFRDIAKVLKVSEETIRKRVNEFRNLRVAALTIEDFPRLALTSEFEPEDPPSFKRNVRKALRKAESAGGQAEPPAEKREASLVKRSDAAFLVKPEREEEIESEEFCEEDIESYICSDPSEIERKRELWERDNREWLEEQANKCLIREQRARLRRKREAPPRRRPAERAPSALSDNALVNHILSSNRTSKKIDTSALERLFQETQRSAERSVHSKSGFPSAK